MSKDVYAIDIYFNDRSATFNAGDTVTGTALLEVTQELKVKCIKLMFLGVARVHWDEKRAYTKGSAAKLSHRNVDTYLDETQILLGKSDTLQPGKYSWPFSMRLPHYLPSTYDGPSGRVHYAAKIVVERSWKGNTEFVKNFNVIGFLDLNSEPDAKKPIENVSENMMGAGCCKSGPVLGHLALPRRGYVLGQDVPFHIRVENHSTKKVTVQLIFSQLATYKADRQSRKSSRVLKTVTKGEVKGGENLVWDDELRAIPTVPPTRLGGGGCRTIDVKYLLTLVIVPSRTGSKIEVPVEVIIGSGPLRSPERSSLGPLSDMPQVTSIESSAMPT